MPRCPRCANHGQAVKRVTLKHLLFNERQTAIRHEPYYVCLTPSCATVYFCEGSDDTFGTRDLSVRFGLKESAGPRPLCYCFGHSVEGIRDEVRRTNRSTVLDRIKAAMQEPGCRCETTNPTGGCCLNIVREAVEAAGSETTPLERGKGEEACCCASETAPATTLRDEGSPTTHVVRGVAAKGHRTGLVAAGGSVLAAILSSGCCWLPLVLIACGVSAAGVAGFLEAWRPYFIAGAATTLGFGFYTVYFRRETGAADSTSCAPRPKLRAFNRAMLWIATGLVGTFVFFPAYVARLFAAPTQGSALAPDVRLASAKFRIEGMTCEGCATVLGAAIANLPDVASVEVDYPNGTAAIRYATESPGVRDRVIQAVEAEGYGATLVDHP